jgi:hypothetical protein
MNEQLQQSLAVILSKATDGVEAGISFLQAEIPDVVQQLLLWKMVSNIFVFVSLAFLAAYTVIKFKPFALKLMEYSRGSSMYYENFGEIEREGKRIMSENGGSVPFAVAWFFVAFVSCLFFMFSGVESAGTALQIWLAPKIYLIEYAASLAK